jgi:hypothetical protein
VCRDLAFTQRRTARGDTWISEGKTYYSGNGFRGVSLYCELNTSLESEIKSVNMVCIWETSNVPETIDKSATKYFISQESDPEPFQLHVPNFSSSIKEKKNYEKFSCGLF